jgi:hypothetical protein
MIVELFVFLLYALLGYVVWLKYLHQMAKHYEETQFSSQFARLQDTLFPIALITLVAICWLPLWWMMNQIGKMK